MPCWELRGQDAGGLLLSLLSSLGPPALETLNLEAFVGAGCVRRLGTSGSEG